MHYKIKRLWHGYASVRDYLVQAAYERGDNLVVIFKDKQMTIQNKDLLATGKYNNFIIQSKHDSKKYRLIDYNFVPDAMQTSFFNNEGGDN